MDPDSDLPALARLLGADYYGVADLNRAKDVIHEQGGDRASRYPRAIVAGIRLLDTVVDMVETGTTVPVLPCTVTTAMILSMLLLIQWPSG